MKYSVVIATHHKTGTVWMESVFHAIARDLGVPFVDYWQHDWRSGGRLSGPFILFDHSSTIGRSLDVIGKEGVRVFHLIRDPRDVLISAMHYHRRSGEPWLHERVPGYDQLTYQHTLNSLPTQFARYVFEMENSTNSTIRDMLAWTYGRTNCFETRYENLRHDCQVTHWSEAMQFLGFDEAEQAICRRRFAQKSLFGWFKGFANPHVRSSATGQWRWEFSVELGRAFLERFPTVLRDLGYESDDEWIAQLSP